MNALNANRASGAAIGFVVAVLFFAVLAIGVKMMVNVPPVDAARSVVRSHALEQIRANEEKSLNQAGWADAPRGIVRLPIETAMEQTAKAWQNPAAARADLNARAEKAAAPAPVVPKKPSAFE